MEGRIEMLLEDNGVRIKLNAHHVSKAQIFGIFDALADSFKLDSFDRLLLGLSFATGGVDRTKVELNSEALELIKKMKENNNETDAL